MLPGRRALQAGQPGGQVRSRQHPQCGPERGLQGPSDARIEHEVYTRSFNAKTTMFTCAPELEHISAHAYASRDPCFAWPAGTPFSHRRRRRRPSLGCPLGRSLPRLPMGSRPGTVAARFSPDGGPPRQHPAVGVRGSIPRVGPAAGASPLLRRGFGLALSPLAASPPTPSPPTPRRRRQLHRRRRRRRRRPRRRGRRRRHPHPPWRVSSVQWSLVSTE